MKKILRYFFVAALAMIGFNANAQEVTLDFTSAENPWNLPTAYDKTEKSYTNGGVTITILATSTGHKVNTKDGYLIFGKKDATLTFSAFTFDVEAIKITGRTGASGKVTQNIFVGETAVSTETTGAVGIYNYKIADAYQAAGTIYVLKLTNDNNTQITKIEIFKKGSGAKEGAGLSWGTGSRTVTIGADDNVFPELTNPHNLAVTYGSSNEEVATIAADGTITLVADGNTVISAKFAGDDTYEAQEVTYTLTVKPAPIAPDAKGGQNNPYNIEELVAALQGGTLETGVNVYVKGYIVDITEVSTQYHNATFKIATANDKDAAYKLEVYRAKYLEKKEFTSEDQIKLADEVIVYGNIKMYDNNGNQEGRLVDGYIYSLNGKTSGVEAVKANAKFEGKMYNVAGQMVTSSYKGFVIMNGKKMIQK